MRRPSRKKVGDRIASGRAPGKVILTGEHFVVLGAPAVAMAIDLYSHAYAGPASSPGRVEVAASIPLRLIGKQNQKGSSVATTRLLDPLRLAAKETLGYIGHSGSGVSLQVECDIPIGAGLGSSASISVAIIAAAARAHASQLGRQEIFKIAFTPENYLHGNPSGVDQAACTYGGVIQFTRPRTIKTVGIPKPPPFLVCDTGIHRSTKGLVGSVVRKSQREKAAFEAHLDEVAQLSNGVIRALKKNDWDDLGTLMNRNQDLLVEIGVSHPKLDKLVKMARGNGALGAKLTGAGGGGCMIALCQDEKSRAKIARALMMGGGIPYRVSMDTEGVQAVGVRTALK